MALQGVSGCGLARRLVTLGQIKTMARGPRRHSQVMKSVNVASMVLAAVVLAGCAVELRNAQPARELARSAEPLGSAYTGWRVCQQRCAGCHGSAVDDGGGAPNLLLRMQGLGPQRLVGLVLRRYESKLLPPGQGTARETLIDEIVERQRGALRMPAWQEEPLVSAHVMDLFVYRSARSEGRLGKGRRQCADASPAILGSPSAERGVVGDGLLTAARPAAR